MELKYFLILFCTILLWGCKPDSAILTEEDFDNLSEQELFFKDYEVPEYKWGFVDGSGKLVIKNIYDNAREFEEGLAPVCVAGKWGYIDTRNQFVIKPQFRSAFGFHNGIARVQNFDKEYYYIKSDGNKLGDKVYQQAFDYNSAIARVKTKEGYTYINDHGATLTSKFYQKASDFDSGYAKVGNNQKYGIIDTQGQEVIDLNYDRISKPYGYPFRVKGGKNITLISKDGPKDTNYSIITEFVNGVGMAKDGAGRWHIIGPNVKLIKSLPANIDQVEYAQCGLWRVFQKNMVGLMDSSGKLLTDFSYSTIYNCKEDRLGFEQNAIWGFLDNLGRVVIKPNFPLVWDFYEGKARVIMERGVGFVDKDGKVVIPPTYIEVRDFHEGLARVQVYR